MKLLVSGVILLTTLMAHNPSEIKLKNTEPLKIPQIEQPGINPPVLFVPNSTCKLEVIELENLSIDDKIKACAKDHSWLKI